MDPQPRIAVIIPCYNHGAYLPEALASVRAQTRPAAECIVIDDGSTDSVTQRILADARSLPDVRVLSQANQGLAAARNAGVQATDAPYFVPLDADDRLDPRFIERLLPALLRDAKLSHAYCWTRFFGARNGLWRCEAYDANRLILHNLHPATALVRRAAYDAVGGYQTDMVHGYEDWDLWLALAAAGWRGARVPEPLFLYRQHAAGTSMLRQMGERRHEMRRRMIEHHRGYFQCWFIEWLGAEEGQIESSVDELLSELEAAIEVDFIERSRAWRWLGGRRTGPGTRAWMREDRMPWRGAAPTRRLAMIRTGMRYRLIQAAKRLPPYGWIARRVYRAEAMRTTL